MHIMVVHHDVAFWQRVDHRTPMSEEMNKIIAHVVAKAPQWLRHDLSAKDATMRNRAEETLVAMIADALAQDGIRTEIADRAAD